MCCGCWTEEGAHQIDNERVRQIATLLEDADEYGALHIVVADNNLEDSSLAWCREWGKSNGWTDNDEALCSAMEAATLPERISAMGIADGCWQFTDGGT